MLTANRHRIRDALNGTLNGKKPVLEFGPDLGQNSFVPSLGQFSWKFIVQPSHTQELHSWVKQLGN